MNLYVVRHGQTDWNVQGRIQGSTDIELNSKGIEQANQVAEKLKNINFASIYSSPLKRTLDTAKAINKYHNLDILTDVRLIERNFGNFEGTQNVLKDISDYLDYELNLNTNDVESIQKVLKRIHNFLFDLYSRYKDSNSNVLLVTHGGISIAITAVINNIKSDFLSLGMKNCEVKVFKDLKINQLEV